MLLNAKEGALVAKGFSADIVSLQCVLLIMKGRKRIKGSSAKVSTFSFRTCFLYTEYNDAFSFQIPVFYAIHKDPSLNPNLL